MVKTVCVCLSLDSRLVQVEVVIPVDEAIDIFPHMQMHVHTGDELLWLTGAVWGLLSQAFSGISCFIPYSF